MTIQSSKAPVDISPVEDIVADMRAGRMVILIDDCLLYTSDAADE